VVTCFLTPILINRLLPIFVLPLGLAMAVLLTAVIFKRRGLIVVGIVILYFFSMTAVSDRLMSPLENWYPMLEMSRCPNADAVMVAGGILNASRIRDGVPEWTGKRFDRGVQLVQMGKARVIIFSGAKDPLRSESEGAVLRRIAIQRGIPSEAIIVTGEVANTAGEARELRRIAAERRFQRIIVVTTAWHMPRAMLLFHDTASEVIPYPVDYATGLEHRISPLDFLPQAGALAESQIAIREYYGLLFYRVRAAHRRAS